MGSTHDEIAKTTPERSTELPKPLPAIPMTSTHSTIRIALKFVADDTVAVLARGGA
jgi:hypothetical protein